MTAVATFAPLSPLTATEVERGWVEYVCDKHGGLVAMAPGAHVLCRCGKRAREERNGRIIDPKTNRPTGARAHVPAHSCSDCGQDFNSKTTQKQHRVGRGSKRRCLTADEMTTKGWHLNARGRWALPMSDGLRDLRTPRAGKRAEAAVAASENGGGVDAGEARLGAQTASEAPGRAR